jgi:hypothetical protein
LHSHSHAPQTFAEDNILDDAEEAKQYRTTVAQSKKDFETPDDGEDFRVLGEQASETEGTYMSLPQLTFGWSRLPLQPSDISTTRGRLAPSC